MISKYLLNQLLTVGTSILFVGLFVYLSYYHLNLSAYSKILIFILLVVCEHYLLNLVHIASHKGISANLKINDLFGNLAAILSGVTLPVFRTTHNLHHAYPNDPVKDPDYTISTKGNLWLIASRIFYHDLFFIKQRLYKTKNYLKTYLATRLIQICIVCAFFLTQSLYVWIYFWLPSMLVIGTMYGLFQFYFPHYTTNKIRAWRSRIKLNLFQKMIIFWIDFSIFYHFKHHQKIKSNLYYFPFWAYLRHRILEKQKLSELIKEVKYT